MKYLNIQSKDGFCIVSFDETSITTPLEIKISGEFKLNQLQQETLSIELYKNNLSEIKYITYDDVFGFFLYKQMRYELSKTIYHINNTNTKKILIIKGEVAMSFNFKKIILNDRIKKIRQ